MKTLNEKVAETVKSNNATMGNVEELTKVLKHKTYLQLIIPQYFISNKSGIWSLSLIVHSKG